jgi:DNA-directed RNA polymerase subunit M/transcription elongation factor TFIIS
MPVAICPKCSGELNVSKDGRTAHCKSCGYERHDTPEGMHRYPVKPERIYFEGES